MLRVKTLIVVATTLAMAGAGLAQEAARLDAPLGKAKLATGKAKVSFSGKWQGEAPAGNPLDEESSVQITNFDAADTGVVALDTASWTALKNGKGFKYVDKTGSAAGLRKIVVKNTKSGGKLSIKGKGSEVWDIDGDGVTNLVVNLKVGDAKWCADLTSVKIKQSGKIKATGKAYPEECPCISFDSTWEGVQDIFDRHGCTQSVCHGANTSGGLDLRPDVAWGNLVDVLSDAGGDGRLRVQPGSSQDSFLWEKLAAATSGRDLGGRGSPMPSGGAISESELETIRLWIQYGAPEDGVVEGTQDSLGACLPPADPPSIRPAPAPAAGEGVQIAIPPWMIDPASPDGPNGEDEVCYALWFDVSDDVPADMKTPCPDFWGGPEKECYFYGDTELTQSPNSHHSILHFYKGEYDLTWEPGAGDRADGFQFRCQSGPMEGETCDPRVEGACGVEGACRGNVISSLACIGYGPPDYSRGFSAGGAGGSDNAPSVGGSQQPYLYSENPPGVFSIFPTSGVMVVNSHAFNLFDTPQPNQQWWNIFFAEEEDRQFQNRGIFDATDIFVQYVPPFEEREYCRTVTMPKGTRTFEFSSHTHIRGRLFRIWGPGITESCRSTMENPEACLPEDGPPIMTTVQYNDPALLRLRGDDIHVLDSDDPADRRYKFCAIYDNGATDRDRLKLNSRSPAPPQFGNLAPGGKCYFRSFGGAQVDTGISCVNAGPRKGLPCSVVEGEPWDGDESVCDSAPGAGDGVCDACPVVGGVTTEDEMFIMLGSYWCDPGSDCEKGVCVSGPNMGMVCNGDNDSCPQSSCGPYSN